MRRQPVDGLVWAPNIDYWLSVNTAEGTLPARYQGMSANDIVRSIGGVIWRRAPGLRITMDPSVTLTIREQFGCRIDTYETPIGSIRQVYLPAEGQHRTRYLAEHFVTDLESLEVMKYVVEATHYEPDYAPVERALADVGDDGVVVCTYFCVPFLQFAKADAGYETAFYLWSDYRAEVDSLVDAYLRKFLEGYRVLADGPADVIAAGDNMDGATLSPAMFAEYARPFYEEAGRIISERGAIFETHWCGRTENLLGLLPGCGVDVVEAVVTRPMANLELVDALNMLNCELALQGGIPSILVCEEGCSTSHFENYIRDTIIPLSTRTGFILGMSDNVPPNADFTRVEAVAGLLKQ